MKLLRFYIAFFIVAISCVCVFGQGGVREQINFNEDWQFVLGDNVNFCAVDFDDSGWRTVDVPHDWSTEFEFNKEISGRNAWLPGGIGWYRKSFALPKGFEGKNIQIQFDGVYKNASIWVNQHPVGTQHDGYTSFYYDISELLVAGQENVIAVRVDNSIHPNCRWYSGAGIYRNVHLNVSDPCHIETWGTYITTPEISEKQARVRIETSIENNSFDTKNLVLETVIFDENKKDVAALTSELKIEKLRKTEIKQDLMVLNPTLWSLEDPILYTVLSFLKSDGRVIDVYESSFGIRSLEFHSEKGFFLNGKGMKMKGVCLHHEAGVLGAAVPVEAWKRRLTELKNIGCNAIRTAHNPVAPEFLDLCDEMGFLVMNEFVDKWENPYKKPGRKPNPFFDVPMADANFHNEWKKNFEATLKRDRNHPSVIIWSVGNENHSPGTAEQEHGLRQYTSFVRSMDPTRPVISGMERGRDEEVEVKVAKIIETCEYMDLIALNYGEQWCAQIGEQKSGKAYVSTESYLYFNSSPEKRWANIERAPWLDVMENEHNMGLFLWVGIDYLGESKTWPKLRADCGLLDQAGFRKASSYLYEAFWSEEPMVHIEVYEGDANDFSESGRWGWPAMNRNWNLEKGQLVDAVTYTNCETVDLYQNGKLIASQNLSDHPNWIIKWDDLKYKKGSLKAVGKIEGKQVCEQVLETTGKPVVLNVETYECEYKPGDIVHIDIKLVDKKGRLVVHDDQLLKFSTTGDSEILGLSNGDNTCIDAFQNVQTKKTYRGRCLCYVRIGESGELNVEVEL